MAEQVSQQQSQQSHLQERIPKTELVLEVFEYAPFERGMTWMLGFAGIGIAMCVLFLMTEGIAAMSFVLAVGIIVGLYIQLTLSSRADARQQLFFLDTGLVHENRYVAYQDLEKFFFFQHPTYTVLHCTARDRKTPDVVIYIPPEIQLAVLRRGLSAKGLQEDTTKKERWADQVVRLLRL